MWRRFRAASHCEQPARYAARLIGSPPLSPVAKSAHLPVRRLIENDPALRSSRTGFRATHSHPTSRPSGSQRATSDGSTCNAAWFTRAKSVIVGQPSRLGVPWLDASSSCQDSIQVSDQHGYPSPRHRTVLCASLNQLRDIQTFNPISQLHKRLDFVSGSNPAERLLLPALPFAAVPSD